MATYQKVGTRSKACRLKQQYHQSKSKHHSSPIGVEMKIYLGLGLFLTLFKVQVQSKSFQSHLIKTAFANISADIVKRNGLVSIVCDETFESA